MGGGRYEVGLLFVGFLYRTEQPFCECPGKKEESSEESWAPNFNSIEYKYGNGVMCEQCGKTNGHVSDCLIGKTQGYARDYWAKSSNSESAKFRIKTYEDNIRLFAKQGREARQRKQAEKSTKLKDYTPMPEREPSSSSSSSSINSSSSFTRELNLAPQYGQTICSFRHRL